MAYEPTEKDRAAVMKLARLGVPQAVIASRMGICKRTLQNHYPEELKRGLADAKARMASSIYLRGIKGDTTAAIFWAKTRMRWRESRSDDATREEKLLLAQCRALGVDPLDLMRFLEREHARLNPKTPLSKALNP